MNIFAFVKLNDPKRIFGLDLMRAIAILLVIGSHALWVFPEHQSGFASLLRLGGVMGVEIFFVLSGFLIGRILLRLIMNESFQKKDFFYFLIRRWFRTLPNYYLVLLLNILIVLFIGRDLPETLPLYFGFLQNFNFGMDIFFTESWSLPIEEFAYILAAGGLYLLLFFIKKGPRKRAFLLLTVLVISFFIGTKIQYHNTHGATSLNFWNIHLKAVLGYRIDAIYYGMLAAYFATIVPKYWARLSSISLFISLFGFAFFHYLIGTLGWNPTTQPFLFNVCYLPICSILIALSLPVLSQWKKGKTQIQRSITWISIISYSMYLLHYSIVLQLMRYFINFDTNSTEYLLTFSIGYLFIVILSSYFLYRFYEKPIMDIRDSKWFTQRYQA